MTTAFRAPDAVAPSLSVALTGEWAALLQRVRALATDRLAPLANATDQLPRLPRERLDWLAALGLAGLTVPRTAGGLEAPAAVQAACTEELAAACGVTTFVWQQHLAACHLVTQATNASLRAELLPRMAAGARWCGVAFSHLRRPGPAALHVVPRGDTYVFEGTAPWVTGFGILDDVVLAGTLPDGQSLYAIVPFAPSAALIPSAPLRLCAMNGSSTVALTCRALRVPAERCLFTTTPAAMAARDRAGTLKPTALTFGVARAADELVRDRATAQGDPALATVAEALADELGAARQAVAAWAARPMDDAWFPHALRLRAWAIALAVRHAHAAVAACGGSANSLDHTAQRLYREALLYTVLTQTPAVREATLAELAASARRATAEAP